MTMNFWEAQRKARSKTKVYLTAFILMTLFVAAGSEYVLRLYEPQYNPPLPILGLVYLGITYVTALFQYSSYKSFGGGYVARQLGARQIDGNTPVFKEKQYYHLVEEMAVASGLPMPEVYVLDAEQVNAFAAGLRQDRAAVTVTQGALNQFTRDELQGVVAHEFGHIYNGDMKISLRLSAMLMGFFIVLYLGIRTLQWSAIMGGGRRSNGGRQGGNPIMLAALILVLAGSITWFFGAILRSMVSRQREYLADACAVQFTRSPEGIGNALRRLLQIHEKHDMPKQGMAYSHLYFNNSSFFSQMFATHPPLRKRIAAIEGGTYRPEEWEKEQA